MRPTGWLGPGRGPTTRPSIRPTNAASMVRRLGCSTTSRSGSRNSPRAGAVPYSAEIQRLTMMVVAPSRSGRDALTRTARTRSNGSTRFRRVDPHHHPPSTSPLPPPGDRRESYVTGRAQNPLFRGAVRLHQQAWTGALDAARKTRLVRRGAAPRMRATETPRSRTQTKDVTPPGKPRSNAAVVVHRSPGHVLASISFLRFSSPTDRRTAPYLPDRARASPQRRRATCR